MTLVLVTRLVRLGVSLSGRSDRHPFGAHVSPSMPLLQLQEPQASQCLGVDQEIILVGGAAHEQRGEVGVPLPPPIAEHVTEQMLIGVRLEGVQLLDQLVDLGLLVGGPRTALRQGRSPGAARAATPRCVVRRLLPPAHASHNRIEARKTPRGRRERAWRSGCDAAPLLEPRKRPGRAAQPGDQARIAQPGEVRCPLVDSLGHGTLPRCARVCPRLSAACPPPHSGPRLAVISVPRTVTW
jgi:hypothetical protein